MTDNLVNNSGDLVKDLVNDTISRAAAIDAMMKLQAEDIEAYGASIPEGFDGDRAVTAIKALPSAQLAQNLPNTCTDAIDREAAIETVRKAQSIGQAHRMLLQLPSVTPKQPGWIPWDSGRFPEESGTYTVTAYDGATKRVTYAKYQKRLKRWELTGARAYWRVLAWMPLPTPYREGGQENA